ncbi:MAG TPA: hypothetical protein VMM55_02565 [Thermohalobaculum sp.]|nr:hypothetical protein [Thermohalobaculum sp.]
MRPILAAAALALAGCVLGTDPLPSRALGPEAGLGGGSFNTGSRVAVAAETFREAGKVAVCAAWATDQLPAMAKPYLDDVLAIGVVQLGGRNVLQGLEDFPRVESIAALPGAPAHCVQTGHAWRDGYAGLRPEIRFGRLELEREDDGLGGLTLSFSGD